MSEQRRIKLPAGFDPTVESHRRQLERAAKQKFGEGWQVTHIEIDEGYAYATEATTFHEVSKDVEGVRKTLRLAAGTKPSDGDKFSGWVQVQYPGLEVVEFNPYAFSATIERLAPDVSRARSAITAALGCKPWDIQISATRYKDGSVQHYDFTLPDNYLPSKHRDRLVEVAQEVLGNLGWKMLDNPLEQIARIVTGDPPIFPPIAEYPKKQDLSKWDRIPIGLDLYGGEVNLVFSSTPSAQISGRSQPLDALIPVPVSDRFPTGWAPMGGLEVGDLVFAGDGTITRIEFLSEIREQPVFEVCFEDGQRVRCSPDHEWVLSDGAGLSGQIHVTTEKLQQLVAEEGTLNWMVMLPSAVETFDADLQEDPYRIGLFFGSSLAQHVRIPNALLRSSVEQRTQLLSGLFDGAGGAEHKSGRYARFVTPVLASDVVELARSLGFTVFWDGTEEVTLRERGWMNISRVADVINTGKMAPQRCIRVTHPSHTYLTAGFIPTCNTGSGKGICISSIIAGCLLRDWEVAIVDATKGAVDFEFARQYCRDSGWGCESEAEGLAVCKLIYEEGQRRKKIVKDHKVSKWTELPESLGLRPILLVLDEVSGAFTPKPMPKGVPKDHPMVAEAQFVNLIRAEMLDIATRIAKELRFVGIFSVQATQKWLASITGNSTELKSNLGAKILLGPSATTSDRSVGLSDPDSVPDVPEYIRADPEMSRGVGVYEFDGSEPGVLKGYYASQKGFEEILKAHNVKPAPTDRRPTASEVNRLSPSIPEFDNDGPDVSPTGGGAGIQVRSGSNVSADFAPVVSCDVCGIPIDGLTGRCRCSE